MDTLDQRRRKQSFLGAGNEIAGLVDDSQYETALSRAHQVPEGIDGLLKGGETTPVAARTGPATSSSPNTMELGLMASPFHSSRIHEEVQLRLSRPATLDQDGMALNKGKPEATEQEPDYGSAGFVLGSQKEDRDSAGGKGIRVAQAGRTSPWEGQASGRSALGVEGHLMLNEPVQPATKESDAASSEEHRSSGIAAQGLELEEFKPGVGDNRELVPVMTPKMEQMLIQVMEENRSLRRRLEQAEANIGWHVRGTGAAIQDGMITAAVSEAVLHSPMSFGPREAAARVDVHSFEGAGRQDLPGMEAIRVHEAQSMSTGNLAQALRPAMAIPGSELVPGLGLGVFESSERDPAGIGSGDLPSARRLGVAGVPPLPITGDELEALGRGSNHDEGVKGQQGRYRTSGMSSGGHGPGSGGGGSAEGRFHTPRSVAREGSSTGGGFDSQGYPLTPGGTVIRPPPGPPPLTPKGQASSRPLSNVAPPDQGPITGMALPERPEEPAKYIYELPKLLAPELSTSAVSCGNWLAQVRQILGGT